MVSKKYALGALFAVITVTMLLSCAGTPRPTENQVTIKLMDTRSIQLWGGQTYNDNPYLPPQGLIQGKPYELAVVKIDANLVAAADFEMQARLVGAEGKDSAVLYSLEDMRYFWASWPGSEGDIMRRLDRLERSYLPSLRFRAPRGSSTWYLVFVGKNPIPRPATVLVKAFIGQSAPYSAELPLDALPAQK